MVRRDFNWKVIYGLANPLEDDNLNHELVRLHIESEPYPYLPIFSIINRQNLVYFEFSTIFIAQKIVAPIFILPKRF